jgi:hypothetical protein
MEVVTDDTVNKNKHEQAFGKMPVSRLLFVHDLAIPSFTFNALKKLVHQLQNIIENET